MYNTVEKIKYIEKEKKLEMQNNAMCIKVGFFLKKKRQNFNFLGKNLLSASKRLASYFDINLWKVKAKPAIQKKIPKHCIRLTVEI